MERQVAVGHAEEPYTLPMMRRNFEIAAEARFCGRSHWLARRWDDGFSIWLDRFVLDLIEALERGEWEPEELSQRWSANGEELAFAKEVIIKERLLLPEEGR